MGTIIERKMPMNLHMKGLRSKFIGLEPFMDGSSSLHVQEKIKIWILNKLERDEKTHLKPRS